MSSTPASFVPQFLSKSVWIILGITALFHLIAGLVLHTPMSIGVLGLVGMVMVVVTYKNLAWGMAVAFFEVIVGAHGHLVDAMIAGFPVSLRMVVFLAVMAGWLMGFMRKRWFFSFVWQRDLPFVGLFFVVLYGVVRGTLLGQHGGELLDDANSYVTLLYLFPLASIVWTQECRRLFLTTFFAGTLWVSFFTLVLTYIFTHISQESIWHLYVLVRDTRMFEVTLLSSPAWIVHSLVGGDWYFRVFSQAQIFVPLYILVLASSLVFLRLGREEKIPSVVWTWFVFLFAAFLQSLSRSFFVGFFVGACALFGFWLLGGRGAWKTWVMVARRKAGLLFSFFVSGALLWALISVPVPERPDLSSSPFYRGGSDNLRELAVSSRWNMLTPLASAIAQHPLLGQGFGKELTYISDDPRIVEMSGGTGELTTYRFEWGFLDVWLKMGVFGVLVYIWILFVLVFQVYRNISHAGLWSFAAVRERWLEIGFVAGAMMLFAVHVFTPYLNHPIGLLYLLVCAFMLDWRRQHVEKQVVVPERRNEVFLRNVSVGIAARE